MREEPPTEAVRSFDTLVPLFYDPFPAEHVSLI